MGNWIESEYIRGHKQWVLDTRLFVLRVQDNGEGVYNWVACPKEYANHYIGKSLKDAGALSQAFNNGRDYAMFLGGEL